MDVDQTGQARKRKKKVYTPVAQTPDLNIPLNVSNVIVSVGLVSSRVNQMSSGSGVRSDSMLETLKKQKCGENPNSGSAAAASGSPCRTP